MKLDWITFIVVLLACNHARDMLQMMPRPSHWPDVIAPHLVPHTQQSCVATNVGPTTEFFAQHVETEPTNAYTTHATAIEDFSTAIILDFRPHVPEAANVGPSSPSSLHPMVTRARDNIFKPKTLPKYDMRRQRILKSTKPQHQSLKNTKNGTSKIHTHRTSDKRKTQKQNKNQNSNKRKTQKQNKNQNTNNQPEIYLIHGKKKTRKPDSLEKIYTSGLHHRSPEALQKLERTCRQPPRS